MTDHVKRFDIFVRTLTENIVYSKGAISLFASLEAPEWLEGAAWHASCLTFHDYAVDRLKFYGGPGVECNKANWPQVRSEMINRLLNDGLNRLVETTKMFLGDKTDKKWHDEIKSLWSKCEGKIAIFYGDFICPDHLFDFRDEVGHRRYKNVSLEELKDFHRYTLEWVLLLCRRTAKNLGYTFELDELGYIGGRSPTPENMRQLWDWLEAHCKKVELSLDHPKL